MEVVIKPVATKKELKTFILLPAEIHNGHINWVPPIYMDEWDFFNPEKNRAFDHCDWVLALAWKDGKTVGRIMGLISQNYNQKHSENHGRFAFIETWNDPEVYRSLIEFVASWAKEKGMVKLIAVPDELPDFYKRIAERYNKNNTQLKILEFNSRRAIKPYVRKVFTLLNQTFTDIYGFTPFTEKEMDDFANRYLFLVNPTFVKLIVNENDDVVSALIAMSDLSKGI